jgi:hypothetical protein
MHWVSVALLCLQLFLQKSGAQKESCNAAYTGGTFECTDPCYEDELEWNRSGQCNGCRALPQQLSVQEILNPAVLLFMLQQVLLYACLLTIRQRSGKFGFAPSCSRSSRLDRSITVALICMLLSFVCVVCCAYQFSPFDSVKYNETGTPSCTYDAECTTTVGSECVDPCTADDVKYERQGTFYNCIQTSVDNQKQLTV